MERKRSFALLISAALGGLYTGYWMYHILSIAASADGVWEAAGVAIGVGLIAPHLICAVLAFIFNTIAYASCNKWLALTGAILYTVAALVFIVYSPFVIIQAILSYVGFARMKTVAPASTPEPAPTPTPAPKKNVQLSNYKGMTFGALVAVVVLALLLCGGGAVIALWKSSLWSIALFAGSLVVLCVAHEKA